MILVVCVDKKNGMSFNGRRQSMDRLLRKRLMAEIGDNRLYMSRYSYGQFESDDRIVCSEDFIEKAGASDYCFAENISLRAFESKAEKIILYRWDKVYPADVYFDIRLDENGWKLEKKTDFEGNSHDIITEEVYSR